MSSKDYKNALNDIRLSSDFCAKMEEKLSKAEFDDDGYQEVENHVEVIENKGFKKYLAAAAIIAIYLAFMLIDSFLFFHFAVFTFG